EAAPAARPRRVQRLAGEPTQGGAAIADDPHLVRPRPEVDPDADLGLVRAGGRRHGDAPSHVDASPRVASHRVAGCPGACYSIINGWKPRPSQRLQLRRGWPIMIDPLTWSPLYLGRWSGTPIRIHVLLILFVPLRLLSAAMDPGHPVFQTACWMVLLLA